MYTRIIVKSPLVRLRLYIIFCVFFPFTLWATPDKISVVIDNNYPPYSFTDRDSGLKGISIDLWKEWEKQTGIRVYITGTNWLDAQRRMEAGEFDVIDTMFYTVERAEKYDFLRPYAKIDVVIFFERTISGITDVNSLKGLMVGVKKGDANIDFLRKNGIEYLAEFDNYEDIVIAAKEKRIKIFVVDKPPGVYYLLKHKAEENFRFSEALYFGEFHRAVRKGNGELLKLIEKGFEKIPEQVKSDINEKWMGKSIGSKKYAGTLKALLFLLSLFAILLAISYVWVVTLRRAVKEKTLQLEIEKEKAENFAKGLLESEKRFMNLYNNISDIIFTIRLNGKFTDMNPRGLKILEYTEAEIKGLALEDVVIPEDVEKAKGGIEARLRGEERPFDFRIRTKSGKTLIVETKGTLLYEGGKPVAIQGIARDITQQKVIEERLLESQKLESLGLLAGGIAHDFNNILMSIINYIEFIKKDYGNKDLFLSDINHLRNSADRAARLVQQLLGFSRKQMILPQPLDINELIMNFQGSLFKFLGENIKTMLSLTEKRPVIFADRSQVEQILMNIVVNSKDAMPSGGRITITTDVVHLENEVEGNRSYNGDFVLISVRDTGCGISDENLKRVFEPFFTTKPVGKGTGLGLPMVYGAMQQNKGFVRIESRINSGTEVRLYFPLSEKQVEEKTFEKAPPVASGNYSTILLVEDDDEVRTVIRQILNAYNFNVIEAKDTGEAVREYENNSDLIRLVISDIVMPDRSGIELKRIINEKFKNARFLFITGYSEEVLRSRGIETGANEILYKPFNAMRILTAIEKMLKAETPPL
ncbi:MAG: transporter substrate-binding domain-containing protein [Deltaproteobacteria bacterium]|nr:transporter substrate-binding domain-containing protein [Deltaproteobacteria bacterium]